MSYVHQLWHHSYTTDDVTSFPTQLCLWRRVPEGYLFLPPSWYLFLFLSLQTSGSWELGVWIPPCIGGEPGGHKKGFAGIWIFEAQAQSNAGNLRFCWNSNFWSSSSVQRRVRTSSVIFYVEWFSFFYFVSGKSTISILNYATQHPERIIEAHNHCHTGDPPKAELGKYLQKYLTQHCPKVVLGIYKASSCCKGCLMERSHRLDFIMKFISKDLGNSSVSKTIFKKFQQICSWYVMWLSSPKTRFSVLPCRCCEEICPYYLYTKWAF